MHTVKQRFQPRTGVVHYAVIFTDPTTDDREICRFGNPFDAFSFCSHLNGGLLGLTDEGHRDIEENCPRKYEVTDDE